MVAVVALGLTAGVGVAAADSGGIADDPIVMSDNDELDANETTASSNDTTETLEQAPINETQYETAVEEHDPDEVELRPELLDDEDDLAENVSRVILRFGELEAITDAGFDTVEWSTVQNQTNVQQAPARVYLASIEGVNVVNTHTAANAISVDVDNQTDVETLRSVPGVEWIHPNYEFEFHSASTTGNTTDSSVGGYAEPPPEFDLDLPQAQWGVEQIDAPLFWETFDTKGGGFDAQIAVLDSGVDADHPDIDVGLFADFDSDGDRTGEDPYDHDDHGTHVSGIVVGGNEDGRYIGVAPDARLYHANIAYERWGALPLGANFDSVNAGIDWALAFNVDVVSMSIGCPDSITQPDTCYQGSLIQPIRSAESSGAVVVSSVGNDGAGTSTTPGNTYTSISVGANDRDGDALDFSGGELIETDDTWGSDAPWQWPDEYVVPSVTAPGCVNSAVPGGEYDFKCGTSQAAPHVSGAVGLLSAIAPPGADLDPDDIEAALRNSAWKPEGAPTGTDTRHGDGVINVHQTAIDLWIDGSLDSEALAPDDLYTHEDDEVEATVTVQNTGDMQHEFFVGHSVRGPDDEWRDNDGQTGTTVELAPGESTEVNVPWEIEDDAPLGEYESEIALWVENDPDLLYNSIERETTDVAFELGEPAEFEVDVLTTDVAGGTLGIEYEVENVGDASGEQDISVEVDGSVECTTSFDLDGGNDEDEWCDYELEAGDAPSLDVSVSSDDDEASTTASVDPAEFSVEIDSTSVDDGTMSVEYTVTNLGDVPDEQDIVFEVEGAQEDSDDGISLEGSEEESRSFSYHLTEGDPTPIDVLVRTDDDSETATLDPDAADFQVTIVDTTDSVTEGEPLDVTAEIKNVGDIPDTQTIDLLDFDDSVVDRGEEQLDPGDETTVELTWATEPGDAGSATITVSTESAGEDTAFVEVLQEASFAVEVTETNSPIEEGDSLVVDVTIENTGDVEETQDIEVNAGLLGSSSRSVTVDGDDSTTETFEFSTGSGDDGSYDVDVESEDDSDTVTVEVVESAAFVVDNIETNSPITEGETLSLDVTIENTGDVSDTQEIDVDAEALGTSSRSVTVDGDDSTTETFEFSTAAGDAGSYQIEVTSEDTSDSVPVEVEPDEDEPFFRISTIDTNAPIDEGEELELTAEIENTGEVTDAQTIDVDTEGLCPIAPQELVLTGGESTSMTFSCLTTEGDAGSYTTTVESEDDADTVTVEVRGPDDEEPVFEIVDVETNDPVTAGESLVVETTVDNVGETAGTQRIELVDFDGDVVDSTERTVGVSETESVTLTWETGADDAGSGQILVRSDDDEVRINATVDPREDERSIRTVENTTLDPGQSTIVTVDVTLEEPEELFISEMFDPAFADVEILADDGAVASTVLENEELVASWDDVSDVQLQYRVTVPDDAEPGESFKIDSGSGSDADLGSDTIDVIDDPLAEYADSDGIVQTQGVVSAFNDWQSGEIGAELLIEVFSAWQSGEPVV